VLSDVDSKHEDDTEDNVSWDESNPESNEVSDTYSEISASESNMSVVISLCFYINNLIHKLQSTQQINNMFIANIFLICC
jgi:hypothetical protein